MKYVGLTNEAEKRNKQHGNPLDWWQKSFTSETEARAWEKMMLAQPDYDGGPGGEGWKYGYIYTITASTIQ